MINKYCTGFECTRDYQIFENLKETAFVKIFGRREQILSAQYIVHTGPKMNYKYTTTSVLSLWPWLFYLHYDHKKCFMFFTLSLNCFFFLFSLLYSVHESGNIKLQYTVRKTGESFLIVFQFLRQFEVMRSCFTTFPNVEKGVEKMMGSVIFMMKLKLFGNVLQHCLKCGYIFSN